MSPQELTALNLDKTGMLNQVLSKYYNRHGDELLGELQFSFLAFLMGQSLEGEHQDRCSRQHIGRSTNLAKPAAFIQLTVLHCYA